MNLNDDVVYRCLRLGPLHQLHPGRSRSLVRYHDRLHDNFLRASNTTIIVATSASYSTEVVVRDGLPGQARQ
jgi:hypothetical protein